jgi:hypothetical protein
MLCSSGGGARFFCYSRATDSTLLLPAEQEPAVSRSAVGSYSARISSVPCRSTKGRARERREFAAANLNAIIVPFPHDCRLNPLRREIAQRPYRRIACVRRAAYFRFGSEGGGIGGTAKKAGRYENHCFNAG